MQVRYVVQSTDRQRSVGSQTNANATGRCRGRLRVLAPGVVTGERRGGGGGDGDGDGGGGGCTGGDGGNVVVGVVYMDVQRAECGRCKERCD